jgi:hypothetical protein
MSISINERSKRFHMEHTQLEIPMSYQARSCWIQTKIWETCFVSTIKANVDVDCGDGDGEERFSEMLDRMSRFISYVESSYRHAA